MTYEEGAQWVEEYKEEEEDYIDIKFIEVSAKEVEHYSAKGFIWDYIKMRTRGEAISFATRYSKENKNYRLN